MKKTILGLALLQVWTLSAQVECVELEKAATDRLYRDVAYLASDELAGRKPGEEGAELAAQYIEKEYRKIGLDPVTEKGYRQNFTIPSQVRFTEGANHLIINDQSYKFRQDFFPVQWSANATASGPLVEVGFGIQAPDLGHDDYRKLKPRKLKNRIFLLDIGLPKGQNPHGELASQADIGKRLEWARDQGAAGVVLINRSGTVNDLTPFFRKIHGKGIPAVFIADNNLEQQLRKGDKVTLKVNMSEDRKLAANILGYIDNGSDYTVVIGAHYDHLGMGGRNSLFSSEEPMIHNGADDNASGVAGLLELARHLYKNRSDFDQYNYLFAAFSGEEEGLLGSSFFTENLLPPNLEIRYMLNMDMIGRMEDHQLAINGTGTSPHWADLILEKGCNELRIKTSASGTGPSDHTNFYYLEIPVLHFFTGTHSDYHKPSDDVEKINFEGMTRVLGYMLGLIRQTQDLEPFPFTATAEEKREVPRFSVTLGVMPDYMFDGQGMRIDGVSPGKPASEAGMQKGDIVIQMGTLRVTDMMSYMEALARFKKGDKTRITYLREGETYEAEVQF